MDGVDEGSLGKVVLEFVWEWIMGEGLKLLCNYGVEWFNRVE